MNRTGITHRVLGGGQQYVEVLLESHETVLADSRALLYVDDGIVLSPGVSDPLTLLKATNQVAKPQRMALGQAAAGQVLDISLKVAGSRLLCRPEAVLALVGDITSRANTDPFVRLSGDGMLFAFALGTGVEHQLAGNQLRLEPASVIAMETSVEQHRRPASEPLSLTVGGHGRVWAQTTG